MVVICVNGYGRSALVENRVDRLVVDESGLCHALHQLARTEVFVDVQSPVDAVVVPDVKGLGGKHLVDEHVEVDLLVDGSGHQPNHASQTLSRFREIARDHWEELIAHLWHGLGADLNWVQSYRCWSCREKWHQRSRVHVEFHIY